jgi:AmmeMemoRadiSam system protein A
MPSLGKKEKQALLKLARSAIKASLTKKTTIERPDKNFPLLQENRGCFVTLHKHGALRGCIGTIEAIRPLIDAVQQNALNAAFSDPRFPAVREDELEQISLEISVLTTPRQLTFTSPEELLDQLEPGVHGVIISQGYLSATYLPQVWDQLPDKESFLGSLCLKAGMAQEAWRDPNTQVKVYEVEYFPE